jgi:CobQ-like glutamine amidotransferase family enzyme
VKLTIAHLYPDLLNLYGDRGNIQTLVKRLEWRDYQSQVVSILAGDKIDFSKYDIVLLGGGTDRNQELACQYLQEVKDEFKKYVEDDGVVLALCGGYQLLGEYYYNNNKKIPALGILNITTTWKPKRFIRNIIIKNPLFKTPIVGFENHSGRTNIGKYTPFGKVFFGVGNNRRSGHEGIMYKNLIGTYLHGPLLPKNPHVCDYLLEKALQRKYKVAITLDQLDDEMELLANKVILDRYSDKKYVIKETIKRYI